MRITPRRSGFAGMAVIGAAVLAAGLLGAVSAGMAPFYVTLGLFLAGVLWVLAERFGPPAVIGLLLLGAVDTLPGPDLSNSLRGSITYQDAVVALLVVLLYRENAKEDFKYLRVGLAGKLVVGWAGLFMLWWGYEIARTWLITPVPLLHAITFSRQYPDMALVLPLLTGVLCNGTSRKTILVVVGVGVFVNCLAQIGAVAGHLSLGFLLHVGDANTATTNGLTRIRGVASDIPFAALPLGYGLWLYGVSSSQRRVGLAFSVVGLVALALGQTRAIYFGAALGLATAIALAIAREDAVGRRSRRGLVATGLAAFAILGATYAFVPSSFTSGTVSAVTTRAQSLITDANSGAAQDSSIEVREADIRGIDYVLRSHWLVGLGSLDASYVTFPDLPEGDIQNTDISFLSAVAMIGIVGVAIYALPLLGVGIALLTERWRDRDARPDEWMAFAGFAWTLGTVAVSFTLGLMFDPAQVVGSAFMIALSLSVLINRTCGRLDTDKPARSASRVPR